MLYAHVGAVDGQSAEGEEMERGWLMGSDILANLESAGREAPYSSLPDSGDRDTALGVAPGKL